MHRMFKLAVFASLLGAVIVLFVGKTGAQDKSQPQDPLAGLPDLVATLKKTPGVLGVDAALEGLELERLNPHAVTNASAR